MDRGPVKQDHLCGGRAGERQRDLTESLKFLDVPGICAACPAECPLSAALQIEIAEILIIEESAPALVLPEAPFPPVDPMPKAVPDGTFRVPVSLKRGGIDLDLPAGTARVRTGASGTAEFFIIVRYCILHV